MPTLKNKWHFCWNGYFGFNIWHSKVKLKWKCKIILGFSALFLILIQDFIMVAVTDQSKLFSSLLDFSFYVITQLQTWAFRSRNLRSDLYWNRFLSSPTSASFPALFHCDTFSDWGEVGRSIISLTRSETSEGRSFKSALTTRWLLEILEFPHWTERQTGHTAAPLTREAWWECHQASVMRVIRMVLRRLPPSCDLPPHRRQSVSNGTHGCKLPR